MCVSGTIAGSVENESLSTWSTKVISVASNGPKAEINNRRQ